jgi:hypothetical protein
MGMTSRLEIEVRNRIVAIVNETCEGRLGQIMNSSANLSEAQDALTQEVCKKMEEIFRSEEFKEVYAGQSQETGVSSLALAIARYTGDAMEVVEEKTEARWRAVMWGVGEGRVSGKRGRGCCIV